VLIMRIRAVHETSRSTYGGRVCTLSRPPDAQACFVELPSERRKDDHRAGLLESAPVPNIGHCFVPADPGLLVPDRRGI